MVLILENNSKNPNAMRRIYLVLFVLYYSIYQLSAQNVGISDILITPDASSMLEIRHTSKGLLIPRMALTQTTNTAPVTSPATSLLVFNTATVNDVTPGFYYWDGAKWERLATGTGGGGPSGDAWELLGNASTIDGTHFLGTTDNVPLSFRVNNQRAGRLTSAGHTSFGYQALNAGAGLQNTAVGYQALNGPEQNGNTAIGYQAGSRMAQGTTNGTYNVAVGYQSLFSSATPLDNTGRGNIGMGYQAGYSINSGYRNILIGYEAAKNLTTGYYNIAIGDQAFGTAVTTGFQNVALGRGALYDLTSGRDNIAIGYVALSDLTTASYNIAIGYMAMTSHNPGNSNVAVGPFAMQNNDGGAGNTAVGYGTGEGMYDGFRNTLVGYEAGKYFSYTASYNTLIGNQAGLAGTSTNSFRGHYNVGVGSESNRYITSGTNNTAIGYLSGVASGSGTISNTIAVGYNVQLTASNTARIGDGFINSIGGQVPWTAFSDERIKTNVQDNVVGLDFIMKLKPVTYNFDIRKQYEITGAKDSLDWEGKYDIENIVFSGFIAQDVENAAQEAGYSFSGVDKPENPNELYGLRYSDFVVPMVKAIQEQQVIIETLKNDMSALQNSMQQQIDLLKQQNELLMIQVNELKGK